jgi:hypothetical protein
LISRSPYLAEGSSEIMPSNWKRLIRFEASDGRVLRGEPILPTSDFDVGSTTEATGLQAKVIQVAEGGIFDSNTKVTDETVTVKKLLGPVEESEVPILRCIGLNFIKHSNAYPLISTNPISRPCIALANCVAL